MSVPEAVTEAINFFASVGVTAAVAGAIAGWIANVVLGERIKARIKAEYDAKTETLKAQLKAQSDLEIEKFKSELSVAAARNTFQFSKLHERRAVVIADIYAALRRAIDALAEYTKIFEQAGGTPREERARLAAEAVNAFSMLYSQKRIFIPDGASAKLDAINGELRTSFIEFAYGVEVMQKSQDHGFTQKWIEISRRVDKLSTDALRELEKDFRILLGDE